MPDLSHIRRFLDCVTDETVAIATDDLREMVAAIESSQRSQPQRVPALTAGAVA